MSRRRLRILVTSGATREPIDGVRCITNFSTGGTGARIADRLLERGHRVFYLHGQSAAQPGRTCRRASFASFHDLDRSLRSLLANRPFDAVIHLAAVGDYSVRSIEADGRSLPPGAGKLDSSAGLTLKLKRNFKIVDRLKSYAKNRRPLIIAFKLTRASSLAERQAAAERLAARPGIDLVVRNDLLDVRSPERRTFAVYQGGRRLRVCKTRNALASFLQRLVEKTLGGKR